MNKRRTLIISFNLLSTLLVFLFSNNIPILIAVWFFIPVSLTILRLNVVRMDIMPDRIKTLLYFITVPSMMVFLAFIGKGYSLVDRIIEWNHLDNIIFNIILYPADFILMFYVPYYCLKESIEIYDLSESAKNQKEYYK